MWTRNECRSEGVLAGLDVQLFNGCHWSFTCDEDDVGSCVGFGRIILKWALEIHVSCVNSRQIATTPIVEICCK
jgi:hypothetical protein